LAVEDAIMIVMDLEMMLKRQGQRVPGAARSVKAGVAFSAPSGRTRRSPWPRLRSKADAVRAAAVMLR
jgi:hypothetical protein